MKKADLHTRVAEVIHYIWDPIGISDVPEARDEYDAYLPKIMTLLENGTPQQLEEYLMFVETDRMGMDKVEGANAKLVEILFAWKEYFSNRSEA